MLVLSAPPASNSVNTSCCLPLPPCCCSCRRPAAAAYALPTANFTVSCGSLDLYLRLQTAAVMSDLIKAKYDWNQVTATLGPWVHQYGTVMLGRKRDMIRRLTCIMNDAHTCHSQGRLPPTMPQTMSSAKRLSSDPAPCLHMQHFVTSSYSGAYLNQVWLRCCCC